MPLGYFASGSKCEHPFKGQRVKQNQLFKGSGEACVGVSVAQAKDLNQINK